MVVSLLARLHSLRLLAGEPGNGGLQALPQGNAGFPSQELFGACNIWPPSTRVVLRQGAEFEGGGAPGHLDDQARQFEHGELIRIADVDWLGPALFSESGDACDEILVEAETARLLATP